MAVICKPTVGHGAKPYRLPYLSDFDLGYIAGLLDGEGCFHIGPTTRYVAIYNTNKGVLEYIQAALGVGNIMKSGDNEKRGFKPCWAWKTQSISGSLGVAMIFAPHLRVKEEAAERLISKLKDSVEIIE